MKSILYRFIYAVILLLIILAIINVYKSIKLKDTYSQINQDKDVLEYFKNKTNGYFVDIGATNGIDISNTYLLEKKYDWDGICIEPNDQFYQDLINNRSCHTDNSLLFSDKGKEVEFSESGVLGGITEYIDKHLDAKKGNKVVKTTDTLNDILMKYNAPRYIHFLSLDTEGSEFEILKGVDLNRYKFGFIALEHNSVEPRRSEMRQYLESFGYRYLKENKHDDYYIFI